MSSIHLRFAAAGLAAAERTAFLGRLRARVARLHTDRLDSIESPVVAGLAVSHEHLPCGGTASREAASVVLAGSIWDGPGAPALGTPGAVLSGWLARSAPARHLWTGVFAFAVADSDARTLAVVSDRFGAMPIYWRERDGIVTVSTQLKALVEPGREKVDREAVDEFVALGRILGRRTVVEGVQRLPAHHVLLCDRDGVRVERLPDPGASRDRPTSNEALDEFDARVERNLKRFADAVPAWTIALSGGLDSRLLAAAAQRFDKPLRAFTAGVPDSLEIEVADKVARHLGIPLRKHTIDGRLMPRWFGQAAWFGEGRILPNHVHYVSANVLGDVPQGPLLHGLIAEGVMGGYGDDPKLFAASPDARREASIQSGAEVIYMPGGMREALVGSGRAQHMAGLGKGAAARLWDDLGMTGEYGDTLEHKFRIRAVGQTVPNLISQVLPWTDVISPFLDRDLLEFCNGFEPQGLMGRQFQLRWAERHFPKITEIPRLKDGVLIPVQTGIADAYDRALTREWQTVKWKYRICRLSQGRINPPHRGSFPFYGQWYRRWSDVRNWVDGIVLSERCLERGIWERDGMRQLTRSLRVGQNTWNALGTILLVELMIRQFVEGTDLPADPVVPIGLGCQGFPYTALEAQG
jgi:hypothetical protein